MMHTIKTTLLALLLSFVFASPALAQRIALRGTLTYGSLTFTADDTFESALGDASAPIFTAGGQVLFPNGVFVEVTTGKLEEDGERVIVNSGGQLVNTGQPLIVKLRPIEVTGGWRYSGWWYVAPYVGAGYTAYRFQELSEFAGPGENIDERFNGFHIMGGVEFMARRWLAIGGEVAWTSVPDAIGERGRSAFFNESNLGGTTLRVKLTLGQ
jgi:opacity protein-like surface antigen